MIDPDAIDEAHVFPGDRYDCRPDDGKEADAMNEAHIQKLRYEHQYGQ